MRWSIAIGMLSVGGLFLAGCGGGDSSEVASADGADEAAQEAQYEAAMGSGGAMPGGEPGGAGPAMGAEGPGGSEGPGAGMYGGQGGPGMGDGGEGDESGEAYEQMFPGGGPGPGMGDEEEPPEEAYEQMYGGQGGPGMGGPGDAGGAEAEMYQQGAMPGAPNAGAMPGGMPAQGQAGGAAAPAPKTFADMAALAFGQGHDKDAFQYLFAHALTTDKATAGELLGKMGWVGPAKRPALAVRWGIGIDYNGKGYTGDLFPIGTFQKMPEGRSSGRGRGRRGGLGQGGMGPGQPAGFGQGMGQPAMAPRGGAGNPILQQYTGELGQKLMEGLQMRLARGDFGEVLKTANSTGGQARQGPGSGQFGRGPQGMQGMGMPGMGPQGMQGMAPQGMQGMEQGMEQGMQGMEGMEGMGPEGMGGPQGFGAGAGFQRGGPGRGPQQPGGAGMITSVVPGVVMLGVAPTKELLARAEQEGVDALCVFHVSVALIRRTGQVSTTTKILIYNVADGKKTFETKKPLNNIQVQITRSQANRQGADPVDQAMEKLFEHVDATWRLGPLPSLQPEHVLSRIGMLLNETHENPLALLAEVRMYHTRGLLQDNHFLLACQRLVHNEQLGTTLATGTEEEKKQVLDPWLPKGS